MEKKKMSMAIDETYLRNLASVFPEHLLDKTMEHIKLEAVPGASESDALTWDRRDNSRTAVANARAKIMRHNRRRVFGLFNRDSEGLLLDISAEGLSIRTSYSLERDDSVELEVTFKLEHATDKFRVLAVVKRAESNAAGTEYGLELLGGLPRDLKGLVNAKIVREKVSE
jgi:hypothetical protein